MVHHHLRFGLDGVEDDFAALLAPSLGRPRTLPACPPCKIRAALSPDPPRLAPLSFHDSMTMRKVISTLGRAANVVGTISEVTRGFYPGSCPLGEVIPYNLLLVTIHGGVPHTREYNVKEVFTTESMLSTRVDGSSLPPPRLI